MKATKKNIQPQPPTSTPANPVALNMPGGAASRAVMVSCTVTAAPPSASPRVLEVAAMFGLGVDEAREMTIVPPCAIPIPARGIVFITGPSGSGKSTILRLLALKLKERGERVFDLNSAAPSRDDDRPLINRVGRDLREATALLSLAGLGDAFVMLRRPDELSDGQRFRFRLAQAMEAATGEPADRAVIVADEFAATLDRLTAKTIARNVRRWIDRLAADGGPAVTFIAATTHDDLLEPLHPDVLVMKELGEHVEVMTR